MKTIYMKVLGMTCDHCRHKIEMTLNNIESIIQAEVNLKQNKVLVQFDEVNHDEDELLEEVVDKITELGYNTNEAMVYESEEDFNSANRNKFFSIAFTFISMIMIYLFLKQTLGFDFLNLIPSIDNSVSLPLLFMIGMMTSIHCVGMCGAINLAASTGVKVKNPIKRPLLYNIGRVISYTITGGIAGLIGQVLTPNAFMQGILVGFAAIFMLFMGLSMLGIMSRKIVSLLPRPKWLSKLRTSSPLLMGLLNGLMPCGPLQAMQIYAISTASFFLGALSMLLFALGTVPLMLLVGLIFNVVKGKKVFVLHRISAVLVVLLSFVMFSRSLGYLGVNLSAGSSQNVAVAEIRENYQYVEIDVKRGSYQKVKVQAGIPVRFNLHAEDGVLNGCNNSIIIPAFDVEKRLNYGDNIVEFTPMKEQTIGYSCWMSMIRSQIIVVDNLSGE